MHPDNLGPQFKGHVKVYRGLGDVSGDQVDFSKVGRHWSTEEDVAMEFADSGNPADKDKPAVMLEGYVHPKHILDPEGRTARSMGADPDFGEEEVTVRKGAPVHVVAMTEWEKQNRGGFDREGQGDGGRRKEFEKPIVAKAHEIY